MKEKAFVHSHKLSMLVLYNCAGQTMKQQRKGEGRQRGGRAQSKPPFVCPESSQESWLQGAVTYKLSHQRHVFTEKVWSIVPHVPREPRTVPTYSRRPVII